MPAVVKIGNKQLIETVSVVIKNNVYIELTKNLRFEFEFVKEQQSNSRIESDIVNNVLKIRLYNFANSLGSSTVDPIEIGTYHGCKLFLHFCVHSIGNDVKMLSCSFFKENVDG